MIVGSAPVGLRLVGGEMPAWSDLERGPARGPALAALLHRLPPYGRVLVAGPHAIELVALLVDRHPQVACLVRSHPDAVALAEVFRGKVDVVCGSLATLGAHSDAFVEAYDAVVAFDGVERLCSTEGRQLTWPESVRALLGAVRAGGSLLLGVVNAFGAGRLATVVEPGPTSPWLPAEEASYGRPAAPGRLRAELREAGARIERIWAGFPSPLAPTVLVRAEALDTELARSGQLDAPIATAFGDAFAGTPLLLDPRRLAAGAVRAGLGIELAPLWIVTATQRGTTPLPRTEPDAGEPDIVVTDGTGALGLTYEISGASGDWVRRAVRGPVRPGPVEVGGIQRDAAALAGPVPAGESLAGLLLDACATHHLPRLRRLLAQWCALAGADALATADAVVATAGGLVVWDPSWSTVVPVRPDVAMARCVRRFAVTVIEGGHPHPWPSVSDANGLATVLGGLAGHTFDPPLLAEAVALEVVVQTALHGLDPAAQEALARRLARVSAGTPPAELRGLRELAATVAALRRDLDHAGAKLEWYERRLGTTEAALRDARAEAAARPPARRGVGAAGRRLARATLRRLGLLSTARRFRTRLRWRV